MRRKRWEARLIAVQVVSLLAEAMGQGEKAEPTSLAQLSAMGFGVYGGETG